MNDGGPAFPCESGRLSKGMSLLDWFAGTRPLDDDAMDFQYTIQCAIVGRPCPSVGTDPVGYAAWVAEFRAKWNYMQAAAMLAERERRMEK